MKTHKIKQSIKDIAFMIPQDTRNAILKKLSKSKFDQAESRKKSNDDYSYKPFVENNCLFIHIPKTGGVSVSKTLFGNLAGGHDSAKHYQCAFNKKDYEAMFKFTFVRNPWDRLYSAYKFLISGGMNQKDRDWAKKNLSKFRDFNDFVINGIGKGMPLDYIHLLPQVHFINLPHSRRFQVDFIGLYENIDADFKTICKRSGLPQIQLPHLNKTKKKGEGGYIEAYNQKSIEIVEELYRRDIEAFGYDFEGNNINNIVAHRKENHYLEKKI